MEAAEQGKEEKVYQLSDLTVERIGLVRQPAGTSSTFFFVKSETGEAEPEADAAPPATQGAEIMTENIDKDKAAPATAPEVKTPKVKTPEAENYAEKLEEYAAKLATVEGQLAKETKTRETFESRWQDERHTRRLAEFNDIVADYAFGTDENFAEDLLTMQDANPELYSRMTQRLDAINEQVKKGDLFAQKSKASKETAGRHPFGAAVETRRTEKYGDLSYEEGYAKALREVMAEKPELSADFAEEG